TASTDAIEFHCTGCGRALKVPAAAAGKRASCPQCNTIVQVPHVTQPQTPATPIPPANAQPTSGDGRGSAAPPSPPPAVNVPPPAQGWAWPPQAPTGSPSPVPSALASPTPQPGSPFS